jgi:hypothetical protein
MRMIRTVVDHPLKAVRAMMIPFPPWPTLGMTTRDSMIVHLISIHGNTSPARAHIFGMCLLPVARPPPHDPACQHLIKSRFVLARYPDSRPPPRSEPRYDDRAPASDLRESMGAKRPRYQPAPHSAPGARDTLCVRGLDDQSNAEEIEQMFSANPGFVTAKLTHAGIAFVKFASEDEAENARASMQGFVVQSEPLVVLNVEIARRSLTH